jgi:hypothetical protein
MAEENTAPRKGPNASDGAPDEEGTATFGYDVAAQASANRGRPASNPNSPLAAG